MKRGSGDGDENRERERRGYRFSLFNFFLLGRWAYILFSRMRNAIQTQRRRFVRRRWGIRLIGTGKPVEKPRQRTRNRRGDGSSSSQNEFEETSGAAAGQVSVAIVHQSAAPTEGPGSVIGASGAIAGPSGVIAGPSAVIAGPSGVIAGPSGLKKGSSNEDTSTNVTEAESKEATDVQEETITIDTSTAGTSEESEVFIRGSPLTEDLESSGDTDEIDLCIPITFSSPMRRSSLDSEYSSSDEEDTTGGTAEGAAGGSTNEENATE